MMSYVAHSCSTLGPTLGPRRGRHCDPVTTRRTLIRLALSAVLVLLSVLILLSALGGGVAYAYWSRSGAGVASGTTDSQLAVTLTPGTAPTGLYPGGQVNVALSVSNPNLRTVLVRSLALDTSQGTGGFAVDGGHSSCSLADLSFTTATNGGTGWTIPAKVGAVNGTLAVTLTNPLAMSATAANTCQGATFTVYLAAG